MEISIRFSIRSNIIKFLNKLKTKIPNLIITETLYYKTLSLVDKLSLYVTRKWGEIKLRVLAVR